MKQPNFHTVAATVFLVMVVVANCLFAFRNANEHVCISIPEIQANNSFVARVAPPATTTETQAIGPKRDVCLYNGAYGGLNFNKIMVMGHALAIAKNISNTSVVRLEPAWVEKYQEWFDDDPTKFLPMEPQDLGQLKESLSSNNSVCHTKVAAKPLFWGWGERFKQGGPSFTGYRPGFNMLPPLKEQFLEDGHEALEWYRRQHHTASAAIVTVHMRWYEGKCQRHAGDGLTVCYRGPKNNWKQKKIWEYSCFYNESFVQNTILPAELPRLGLDLETALVIMVGDGQNKDNEGTFRIRDNHTFPIQVAMMMLSDYHVGNPLSTIDAMLAHWRRGRGSMYPEKCFGHALEHARKDGVSSMR